MKKMLQFNETLAAPADKKTAEERLKDFKEIYKEMSAERIAEQASRCAQCGIPFCQSHCPLQNNIPDWLRAASEGRFRAAYELMSSTNTFPEVCGKICPQDRLCEGHCVVNKSFNAVTIGDVEQSVTQMAFANNWVQARKPKREKSQSVAIVGSGPAGLAAAEKLRAEGYKVKVFERQERAGGLLMYGIPHFKLEKEVVFRRIELLEEAGVEFVLNTAIGKDISFEELRSRFDAILLATGVYRSRELGFDLPPESSMQAFEFLKLHNRFAMGEMLELPNLKGKDVVVIGGGDTAMDCVRTAVRRQAKSVRCVYRRDENSMPGSMREVKNAKEEGVVFEWLLQPEAPQRFRRVKLGPKDVHGRQAIIGTDSESLQVESDFTVTALGFQAEDLSAQFSEELGLKADGTIQTSKYATNLKGVFAAGDIVRGASLVVWAIKDGREAAKEIDHYLQMSLQPQRNTYASL